MVETDINKIRENAMTLRAEIEKLVRGFNENNALTLYGGVFRVTAFNVDSQIRPITWYVETELKYKEMEI